LKISFDLDNTLRNHDGTDILPSHEKVKKQLAAGHKVIIVTRRHEDDTHAGIDGQGVLDYVKDKLGAIPVIFDNSQLKYETLDKEEVDMHYDDDPKEIEAINKHTNIKGVLVTDGKGVDKPDKKEDDKKTANTEITNAKDATVLFYDYGNYLPFIRTVAKQFKKVYYYNPNIQQPFPTVYQSAIGYGLDEVEMIDDDFKVHDEVDLFILLDLTHGYFQNHLTKEDKLVWGSKRIPEIEVNRDKFKELLKSLGLPVNKYQVVTGIENLKEHLKEHKNVWVKINKWRGLTETFKSENEFLSRPEIDKMRDETGLMGSEAMFIVEEQIDTEAEIGFDGMFTNGQYRKKCLYGVEIKDCGYCGKVIDYDSLPKVLKEINEKFAPILEKAGYCNFISTEVRMAKDGTGYFIDPAMRMPSPPGEIYGNLITNIGELMFQASLGRNIEPEHSDLFGMQAIIWSQWSNNNWNNIEIPDDIKPYVKIKNLFKVGNKLGIAPPMKDLVQIGSIVCTGSSIKECVKKIMEYSDKLKGIDLVVKTDELDKAVETFAKAEKYLT
jgi:hypothetical protein